jgi:hypothetical protein
VLARPAYRRCARLEAEGVEALRRDRGKLPDVRPDVEQGATRHKAENPRELGLRRLARRVIEVVVRAAVGEEHRGVIFIDAAALLVARDPFGHPQESARTAAKNTAGALHHPDGRGSGGAQRAGNVGVNP